MTKEQEELFKSDPFVKMVIETAETISSITLVGGAVIDILEGRGVKDYDCVGTLYESKLGLEYSHETKSAKTFKKGDLIIQLLKTDKTDFDFKISQASLTINYKKELSLEIDGNSFEKKILIPCDKAWIDKKNALNSLRRVPHWIKKGYTINETTYLSLLGVACKNSNSLNS